MTSRVLLRRHVLYRCATTAALTKLSAQLGLEYTWTDFLNDAPKKRKLREQKSSPLQLRVFHRDSQKIWLILFHKIFLTRTNQQ